MVTCEWPPRDGRPMVLCWCRTGPPDLPLVRLASGEELRGEAAMPSGAGHERALDISMNPDRSSSW
jgi:hypothetical protein